MYFCRRDRLGCRKLFRAVNFKIQFRYSGAFVGRLNNYVELDFHKYIFIFVFFFSIYGYFLFVK